MRCCKLVEQCTEQKACAACCNWSLAHETVFRCNLGCLQVFTSTPTFRSCHFLKENLKITNMVTQEWTVSFLHDTAVFMDRCCHGPLQMEKDDKGSTMIRMGVSG